MPKFKPTDEDATVHTTGKPMTLVAYWSALLNIVLGAMLSAMLLSIYLNLTNSRLTTTSVNKSTHVPRNCGFTAAEAMARDCEFDLLLVAWVPRECRDYASADAFTEWVLAPERKPQPFPYFRNEDNTGHIESLRELAEYPGKSMWYIASSWLFMLNGNCKERALAAWNGRISEPRILSWSTKGIVLAWFFTN
ncbi:hypothetical protein LTR17_008752 [Elasticomyces elasticus]|nr:hypothetical protein LTR17_008752 [Elasticomyces elasticus]